MSSVYREELSKAEIAKKGGSSIVKLVVYIVAYVAVAAIVQWIFISFLPQYGINISDYLGYIQILLALAFGYMIVNSVATLFYWSIRGRYDHSTAAAIRNIIRIIGIGALISAIAGGVAGGAAGVALGGFLGLVVGFASQQVLGQAVAGLFLLISRPFRIGDEVVIAGEEGTVEDVSTLFTILVKKDGSKVIMPNNSVLGGKIYLKSISSK
ncbi:MAG: mechanosensitive ion channel domain-containing protein [Candidatus Caldarchaeales archaeon]